VSFCLTSCFDGVGRSGRSLECQRSVFQCSSLLYQQESPLSFFKDLGRYLCLGNDDNPYCEQNCSPLSVLSSKPHGAILSELPCGMFKCLKSQIDRPRLGFACPPSLKHAYRTVFELANVHSSKHLCLKATCFCAFQEANNQAPW
jgi:hypothetical protein